MERIFSRQRRIDVATALKEHNESSRRLTKLPIAEAERQIAEDRFRKPIVILDLVAIRPFWKDGRKAPSLPSRKLTKQEALEFQVRGH